MNNSFQARQPPDEEGWQALLGQMCSLEVLSLRESRLRGKVPMAVAAMTTLRVSGAEEFAPEIPDSLSIACMPPCRSLAVHSLACANHLPPEQFQHAAILAGLALLGAFCIPPEISARTACPVPSGTQRALYNVCMLLKRPGNCVSLTMHLSLCDIS